MLGDMVNGELLVSSRRSSEMSHKHGDGTMEKNCSKKQCVCTSKLR